MPTRDRLGLLVRAVRSVLSQTYQDLELIVIDDGSRDGTQQALQQMALADARVRPLVCEMPAGACAARNLGIAAATGKWITGCDDDDYFEPHRLQELVWAWDRLEQQGGACVGLYTDYFVEDRDGRSLLEMPGLVDAQAIKTGNRIGNQVFTLTQTLRAVGGFDPGMPAWQDFELWLRIITSTGPMMKAGTGSYVNDRSHGLPRISSNPPARIKAAYERLVEKHGHLYTHRERALLYLNYLVYEQVPLGMPELVHGWRAGEFRAYAGALLAKMLRRTPR